MANLKISELTSASTPLAGTEVLPIVQSSTTVKVATNDLTVRNVRAAATTGILQVSGPSAAATRIMTVPDANFTAARTDAGQTFTGNQVITASGTSVLTVQTTGTSGQEVDIKVLATNSDASSNQWKLATNVAANNEFILYDLTSSQVVDRYIRGASGYRAFWVNGTERVRIDVNGNVGVGTSSPNASAILDAQSTTKGVRFPNMTTTQKNAVSSPAAGLVVFDTTLSKLCVYSGAAWQTITSV